ncbi:copper ABC transporter permease protein [Halorhabdus tiamatea SARL4B]|uniref:ABC-2-type transporter, permease protein (Probable substrate copper) n=1 Tax=Halorhabdus tiamatea SARL4B TaxID=1033806 RepID=F7PPW1_9EURY|nr:ABC transporter permease subunit [Halorhabdus tiamatea]ERJ05002.1 copper ABC transporter permease protein [Halorhabdus tiamatea SARL4B]CCQ32427.1 ABC-2-type transporter, permease protein (probable substrate copper) [Halorhabdus tiamatea SARL4B]
MNDAWERTIAVAQRAFDATVRSRALFAVAAGYAFVVLAIAWTTRGSGYLSLTLSVLTPLEVLVPVVAFAIGYRSILDDRVRGELAVFRTYPLSARSYVVGVFLGRLATLLLIVLVPLLLAGGSVVAFREESISVLATHATADSPLVYLRTVALTAAFAPVALGVAIAVSSIARTTRNAIALAVGGVVVLVVGLDLGFVAGLAGGIVSPEDLSTLSALSPLSAYRGLVLEMAIGPVAGDAISGGVNPLVAFVGLAGWTAGGLAVAIRSAYRSAST